MSNEKKLKPNFLEVKDLNEANEVNMEVFRFERFSESRDRYIFVKRRGIEI